MNVAYTMSSSASPGRTRALPVILSSSSMSADPNAPNDANTSRAPASTPSKRFLFFSGSRGSSRRFRALSFFASGPAAASDISSSTSPETAPGDATSISCASTTSARRSVALNSTSSDSSTSKVSAAAPPSSGRASATPSFLPTTTASMDRISNATNASAKEKTLHITSCAGFTGVTLSANFWITEGSGLNRFSPAKSVLASSGEHSVTFMAIWRPRSCTSNVDSATETSDASSSKTLMYTWRSTASGTALMLYTGSAISQSTNVSISTRDFLVDERDSRFWKAARSIWLSAPRAVPASISPTFTMMSKPRTSAIVAPLMVPKICFRNPTYVSRSSFFEKNRDVGPPRNLPFARELMYASTYASMMRSVSDSSAETLFGDFEIPAAVSFAAASLTVSATAASLARRRNLSGSPRNTNSAVPTTSPASAVATLATFFSSCGKSRETGGAFSSSRTSLVKASSLKRIVCVFEGRHPFSAFEMVSEYLEPKRRAEKLFSASSMM